MDEHLDELRRSRTELVARSERLRLWSRLAGARMDLLTAQVCPPATAEEVVEDELAELAGLVLGAGPATTAGEDRVEVLLALRAARRDLARRRERLDDLVCWATAELLLEASGPTAGSGSRALRAGVPGQRSAGPAPARATPEQDAPAHLVAVAGTAVDGPPGAVASTTGPACHTPG